MAIAPIVQDLQPSDIALEDLYLDPNNPRFVTAGWNRLPDDEIAGESVQDDVRTKLIQRFDVDRLRKNMEVNGYLPIDRVIVREFSEGKFVVLEGNRRICAAKLISRYAQSGERIDEVIARSVATIPCLVYTGQKADAAWIFQGIRHISGLIDWSSFNKAKLLVEQMESDGLSLTEVGQRFGISGPGAGQWVRGYKAFQHAQAQPEFGPYVNEEAYPFFMEMFSRSSGPIRAWLEWDDANYVFKNEINFMEFLEWLYPEDTELPEGQRARRDWSKRSLSTRDDMREVAYLISQAKPFFEQFRDDRDVHKAYTEAQASKYRDEMNKRSDAFQEILAAIAGAGQSLAKLPWRVMRDNEAKKTLFEALGGLKGQIDDILRG